jgi:hypothetical protein
MRQSPAPRRKSPSCRAACAACRSRRRTGTVAPNNSRFPLSSIAASGFT